ncbi:MAG: HEAT repeat domain-containing protein [Anaerolineae bacterium]|nr:HEAT repeat domain-containing protein [Anaerolineae bacterium]
MGIITPGRRPAIGEIRAYYTRPEILNEILQAMQRWHVSFVPGYVKQSWVYIEDAAKLRAMLMQPLDLMEQYPERTEYPYFRINWARHNPAHSWNKDTLRGYDFVIEKDSFLWQECFEAMLPVMDILEHFGVTYWLKYTGHHSLHLVVPAECFPREVRGVPLTDVHEAVYHRLMVFLNKRARQHYNEHNRHCPPGTNMPYSVNEDTGLVNIPLLREELATFRPWQASIYLVQPRDFWRSVPESARGCAAGLLDKVLRPSGEQARFYPPPVIPSERSESRNLLTMSTEIPRMHSASFRFARNDGIPENSDNCINIRERRLAVWKLMLSSDENDSPTLIAALADEDADVRWFAAEALARIGSLDALPALLALPYDDMTGACLVDFCVRHGEVSIPALIEALKTFTAPWSSPPVDKALERIGEVSISHLQKLLDDSNHDVRKRAASILERISGTPTLDDVLAMSTTHNRKHNAAQMLGWYDEPRAHQRLTELTTDRNPRVRKDAIKALLWTDHPDAEQLLQRALTDENDKVRRWAENGIAVYTVLKRLAIV